MRCRPGIATNSDFSTAPDQRRIAPLSLLPPRVAHVAGYLWFPYVLSFPVQVLTGTVTTTAQYVRGFAGQLIWLAIWLMLYLLVWTRGRRHYGAVGG